MNTTDLLVLGLLVLVANLTLSALFVPPKASPSVTEPLVRLWKLLALAFAQIAAWAVVLDQGGAVASLSDAVLRAAGCFALVSGVQGTPVFPPPWNHFAGLIALNGLLFVPVTLLPALFPTIQAAPPAAQPAPAELAPPITAPSIPTTPPAPAPAPIPQAPSLSAAASPLVAEPARPPLPPPQPAPVPAARPPSASEPAPDPEAEYAALLRPLGPTPPPIRFGNRP